MIGRNSKIKINGSGRTDAGVHAKGQSANFVFDREIKDKHKFLNSMNFFLKKRSISITRIKKKDINFHARHSAKKKIYKYSIFRGHIGAFRIFYSIFIKEIF